jgi:alcohol dehydrogenase (cytochrome c)
MGGVLTTASDLMFVGEQNGDFQALDAATGERLWSHNLVYGICTPAVTYRIKGVQYVTVSSTGCRGGHRPEGLPAYDDTITTYALPTP